MVASAGGLEVLATLAKDSSLGKAQEIAKGVLALHLHNAPLASGAIVGTALKEEGVLSAPVSQDRVSALRDALSRHW